MFGNLKILLVAVEEKNNLFKTNLSLLNVDTIVGDGVILTVKDIVCNEVSKIVVVVEIFGDCDNALVIN